MILDAYCILEDGRKCNVEVQNPAAKLFDSGVAFQIVKSALNLSEDILKEIYEEVNSGRQNN